MYRIVVIGSVLTIVAACGRTGLSISSSLDGGIAGAADPGGAAGSGGAGGAGGSGGMGGSGATGEGMLFGPPVLFAMPDGYQGGSVAIADVTSDGSNDVVVGAHTPDVQGHISVVVFPQTASPTLGAPISYDGGDRGESMALDTGDLDGDGRSDVAFTRRSDIAVMRQNPIGGFYAVEALPTTQVGQGVDGVAIADVNSDGRADVVGMGWASPGVDVWFQDSSGGLMAPQSFACPHNGYDDIAIGDLDGDGRDDILLVSQQSWNATYLLQAPSGFAPYATYFLDAAPMGAAIGDLDGDGRDDFVFTFEDRVNYDPKIGLIRQTASGMLGPQMVLSSANVPSDVKLADVDFDGRLDVIVNHDGWGEIGIYRQLPEGGLAPEELYTAPFASSGVDPDQLAVGDLNGDGRPDIAFATAHALAILYHR